MNHGFGYTCRHLLSLLLLMTLGLTPLTGQALPTHAAHAAGASIRLSPTSGPATTQITVTGSGFGSRETVIITFASSQAALTTTTSDTSGRLTTTLTVPAAASPGTHRVQATGQTSGVRAQALFLVQTTWPMFGFDPQHSNLNPYEHVLSPTNASHLTLDWGAPMGIQGDLVESSPAVVNGMVYVDDAERSLDAFNATTGALTWQYYIDNPGGMSSPAVADGLVYVGTDTSSTLYALNARTGVLVWSYSHLGLSFGTPTIANGILYVQVGCIIYAFNAHSGKLLWSVGGGGANATSAPAVANGVLYGLVCQTFDYTMRVEALNAQTGALLWTFALLRIDHPGFSQYDASPSVANGLLYILGPTITSSGQGETLYALDTQTGTLRWKVGLDGGLEPFALQASPAVANGVVYIGTHTGTLFAFDAQTGTSLWSFAAGGIIASPPSLANGILAFGTSGIQAIAGELYLLDAQTGKVLWSYAKGYAGGGLPNGTFTAVVVNGIVYACRYVGAAENQLAAFHLPSAPAR